MSRIGMSKTIIVYRGWTGRFWASRNYKQKPDGSIWCNAKDDVTEFVRDALQGMSLAEIKRFRSERTEHRAPVNAEPKDLT